ncbi:MAG: tRNA (cytidine(34)-2'-O)-methyltransferase [Candidatus Cloacimonetes bacterium]|nr:tRNA (cytidine(34)-2'-O)-methyltransferase [Candidatus Cloacimonadota bacterium]
MAQRDEDINFRVVLYQPEIPANTGNIGRLCLGMNAALHLIRPVRFLLTDKYLKRAGLDYWDELNVHMHSSLTEFRESYPESRIWLCSTKAVMPYHKVKFQRGDALIFGPESRGLPEELLREYSENTLSIPMTKQIRSFNLANSVGIILSEGMRQLEFPGCTVGSGKIFVDG